ncbi:MAG: sugar phosphate nucleotidyltransferase [Patescibacteria group bacterium]
MSVITTLVVPVAGKGVRLLPLTEKTPKALILLQGKPLLSYILEEAVQSGIVDVVLIISPDFREQFAAYHESAKSLFSQLRFHIYEQIEPWGNGRAVLLAYEFLKKGPFVMRFPDDIFYGDMPAIQELVGVYEKHRQPVILLDSVPWETVSLHGLIGIKQSHSEKLHVISEVIEKSKLKERAAPSNLTVVGGYVITPTLLEHLKEAEKEAPQILDGLLINAAFHRELSDGGEILGVMVSGRRFDCGKLEGLAAAEEFLKNQANSPHQYQ